MKSKAWLMILFTLSILVISICFPILLFNRQEAQLLKMVHTEKLAQPSSVRIPMIGIMEKLTLISDAGLSDSNIVVLQTSGHTELSTMKEALKLSQESISELSRKGLIPETDLSAFTINEFSQTVYSDTSSKASVSCYTFWANSKTCDFFITIDADTGKIYALSFIPFQTDSDVISFVPSSQAAEIWGAHLGVSLVPAEDPSDYDIWQYQIEDSNLYYLFSRPENTSEMHIRLVNGRSFGFALSNVETAVSDDTTMMHNRRTFDTTD